MFKPVQIALTSAILLLSVAFASAQTENPQLTGTVGYRERIALPVDAVIDVQLVDASVTDVAAQTVAEVLINAEGRQVPVPFTLTYDPVKIVPGNRYSVRATIRSGDGMLMFSSTQAYPVLTHGATSKVNLILHTVGHGAHASSVTKKEATPSPSAAAETAPTTPKTASPVEPATSEKAPAQPEEPPAAPATEQPSTQPERPPTTDETANSVVVTPQVVPESKPSTTEAAPSSPAPSAEAASHESSAAGQSATETSPSQNATTAMEAPAPTQQPANAPAAATQPESSSRDAKPVDTQPAATEPAAPAPETKSAEAPLPDSPSTTKQAELAAAAPPESAEAAPDSMPAPPAPNKALTPLADTQWKLVQLGGLPVVIAPAQKPFTLAFSPEGRRIAGSAGCNSYLGTFTDDHGHLELHPGSMTMMACADPAGSREKKFVAMLRTADGYKISGGFLLLTSNGKTVAKFRNNQE